jgi:hypothetical protein
MSFGMKGEPVTTKSLSQVPRELASNWVYKVHAWRGKSPEFMQAQVGRLEAVIREAMQKAFEEAVKAVGRVIADEMCVDASDESHQWLKTALAAVQAAASSLTEQETTKCSVSSKNVK